MKFSEYVWAFCSEKQGGIIIWSLYYDIYVNDI